MSLQTQRFKPTDSEPHSLEVKSYLLGASTLLLYLEMLRGVQVLSKRSWAMTDDFEAYFTYKGRMWVVATPFSKIEVSLLGQPADETIFREIEARVQAYPFVFSLLLPLAFLRYVIVRFTPSRAAFHAFGVPYPGETSRDAL
ncbi:MAG: hypothetical protein KIS79_17390 [Burkholderiales bacterium]|jgi:hypothetical protein|nr:hypothetical protein [Burkholderiales bacterium]